MIFVNTVQIKGLQWLWLLSLNYLKQPQLN